MLLFSYNVELIVSVLNTIGFMNRSMDTLVAYRTFLEGLAYEATLNYPPPRIPLRLLYPKLCKRTIAITPSSILFAREVWIQSLLTRSASAGPQERPCDEFFQVVVTPGIVTLFLGWHNPPNRKKGAGDSEGGSRDIIGL